MKCPKCKKIMAEATGISLAQFSRFSCQNRKCDYLGIPRYIIPKKKKSKDEGLLVDLFGGL